MPRIEIVANHSVEENILEAFAREQVGKYYTKYPNVFGVGSSGPRMGDAIWPEENFALVIWCEEEEARGIARAVAAVKEQFPDEGIKVFGLPGEPQISRFPVNPPTVVSIPVPVPASVPSPPASPERYATPLYTLPGSAASPPTASPPSGFAASPPVASSPAAGLPAAVPPVSPPQPSAEAVPPKADEVETEYDGQNMDEI